MLMSLLPGLRDLRTPLATGYVWLIWLWLAFSEDVATPDKAHGVLARVYQLADSVGPQATLAAVSFTAYLIGSVTQIDPTKRGSNWNPFRTSVGPSRKARQELRELVGVLSPSFGKLTDSQVHEVMGEALRPRSYMSWSVRWQEVRSKARERGLDGHTAYLLEWNTQAMALVDSVIEEMPQLKIRLQARNRDLYDTCDRLAAEGELRTSILLPLCLLVGALASKTNLLWLLLMPLPILIGIQGYSKSRGSLEVLVQALQEGDIIASTTMERGRQALVRTLEAQEQPSSSAE
jgi:hypothetical protein